MQESRGIYGRDQQANGSAVKESVKSASFLESHQPAKLQLVGGSKGYTSGISLPDRDGVVQMAVDVLPGCVCPGLAKRLTQDQVASGMSLQGVQYSQESLFRDIAIVIAILIDLIV